MLNGPIIPAKSNDSAAGSAVDNSVIPELIIDEGFIDDVNILEEDNATQPWTVLVDIKGVTSVDLFPTEPPVAAPAADGFMVVVRLPPREHDLGVPVYTQFGL